MKPDKTKKLIDAIGREVMLALERQRLLQGLPIINHMMVSQTMKLTIKLLADEYRKNPPDVIAMLKDFGL